MKALRISRLYFCLFCMFLFSCSTRSTPVPASPQVGTETVFPSITSTPTPTNTKIPTNTPIITPTYTLQPSNESGLIVTLGEKVPDFWYPGVPVFSPDGQLIALVSSRIRFWNVSNHELVFELENPYSEGCRLANAKFSPDGNFFAVSITECQEGESGHLLVWDLASRKLLHEWNQEYAKLPPTSPNDSVGYSIPVSAMVFVPNSSKLIFGNGNAIETIDILDFEQKDTLKLGPKMFASQISLSSYGRLAYIIMRWEKTNDFPAFWTIQHKLQIWNINTHAMLREVKYPEGWVNISLELLGTSLVQVDHDKGTSQILNLETENVRDLPFRQGWRYYNSDGSLVLYARFAGFEEEERTIELWKTDSWEKIYTFMPDFGENWIYGLHDIVFSPDNTILAIAYDEQVSLWNIGPVVRP